MNSYYESEDMRDGAKVPTVRLDGDFTALELYEVMTFQMKKEQEFNFKQTGDAKYLDD